MFWIKWNDNKNKKLFLFIQLCGRLTEYLEKSNKWMFYSLFAFLGYLLEQIDFLVLLALALIWFREEVKIVIIARRNNCCRVELIGVFSAVIFETEKFALNFTWVLLVIDDISLGKEELGQKLQGNIMECRLVFRECISGFLNLVFFTFLSSNI